MCTTTTWGKLQLADCRGTPGVTISVRWLAQNPSLSFRSAGVPCLPAGQPPVPERDFDSVVPVRVRLEAVNSLNNRFKEDPGIRNRCVCALLGGMRCAVQWCS